MGAKLIAITGGIGSGKSVISRILRVMGYDVFDCDLEAKRLMDDAPEIKHRLRTEISELALNDDGSINRTRLSEIVFNDRKKLDILNSIVHSAVREEIFRWQISKPQCNKLFVETAILYQSGLDKMVDEVWEVVAPEDIRILRVIRRNNCSPEQVKARINAQKHTPVTPHPSILTLVNDDIAPILPQISEALKQLPAKKTH